MAFDLPLITKHQNSSWYNAMNEKPTNIFLNSTDSLANITEFDVTKKKLISILQEEFSFIWIVFGTIGNILSLLVLLRRKMRIHSTFTYLTILSLCDTLVLYFGLLRDFLVNKYKIDVNGDLFCKFHVFSFYFVLHMASWLLVAVNVDRLIAASFLSFSKKWCTPRTAIKVSIWITLSLALLNSHFIYYVDSSSSKLTSKQASYITSTSSSSHHQSSKKPTEYFIQSTATAYNNFINCLTTTPVDKKKIHNNLNNISNLLADCLLIQQKLSSLSNNNTTSVNKLSLNNIRNFLLLDKYNNNNSYLNSYLAKYGINVTQNQHLKYISNLVTSSTKTDYMTSDYLTNVTYYKEEYTEMYDIEVEPDSVNPYVYQKCLIKANNPKYSYFFQNIFTWLDTSMQVILPFVIMVICNFNIIYKVLLTKSKTNGKNLKRLRKIKGMCIMIVSVSVIFFVLEAPILIFICLIQGQWVSQDWSHMDMAWTILNLMMYTNHVINFFSYCMTGTKFRRELLKLLCVDKILNLFSNNLTHKQNGFVIDNPNRIFTKKPIKSNRRDTNNLLNIKKINNTNKINVNDNNDNIIFEDQDEIVKLNENSQILCEEVVIKEKNNKNLNNKRISCIKNNRINFNLSKLKVRFEKNYSNKSDGLINESVKLKNQTNVVNITKPISLTKKIMEKKRELNEISISLEEIYSNNEITNVEGGEAQLYVQKIQNKKVEGKNPKIGFMIMKKPHTFMKNLKNSKKKLNFFNFNPTPPSKFHMLASINNNNKSNTMNSNNINNNKINVKSEHQISLNHLDKIDKIDF
jgi:hypothetical protein